MTDLVEARVGEDAATADMELASRDLLPGLRDHRVALEGSGAALSREVDGGARKRTTDTAAPEVRAGDEAAHGPDAVVGLVLRSARPGHATEAHVSRAGLARFVGRDDGDLRRRRVGHGNRRYPCGNG